MIGRYDFSDPAVIAALPVRLEPHWHVLQYCRHIGVIKRFARPLSWVARFRTKQGTYRQEHLGKLPGEGSETLSYAEAVAAAETWFTHPSNANIAADSRATGSKTDLDYCPWGDVFTVGHAMRDFIEWKRIAATKDTFGALLSLINHHILPSIGSVPLAEFKGHAAKAFTLDVIEQPPKRGNQPLGPKRSIQSLSQEELRTRKATVNTLLGILRLAFKLAWENGATDDERAWRCIRRLPNRSRPRMLYLNRDECRLLLNQCRPDLRDLVLGALYTGCRATELDRLKVGDVAQDVFGIYVGAMKSGPPRFVFLPDEGMEFFLSLVQARGKDEPAFLHQDGTDWRGRYKHLFRNAIDAAGLPEGFVFHGLRHTYASQLVQAATPLIVVAQQLGHATADTVARTYGHMAPQIREMQVRKNFAPLMERQVPVGPEVELRMQQLTMGGAGEDWRTYAAVEDGSTWPKANFSKNSFWKEPAKP